MIITIDAGNTLVKLVVWDNQKVVRRACFPVGDDLEKNIYSVLETTLDRVYISSVISEEATERMVGIFKRKTDKVKKFDSTFDLPIKVHYENLSRLGTDRLLAALGVHYLFKEQDALIIDAGTCVKYGFLSSRDGFMGGFISPGIRLRFGALHENTAQLPGFETVSPSLLPEFTPGRSTRDSIHFGIMEGMVGEMEHIIHCSEKILSEPLVIFTGGDYHALMLCLHKRKLLPDYWLKNRIFAEPDLIHYALLKYFSG